MIRVAIFEDNKSLLLGLYHLIQGSPGFQCVGTFERAINLEADLAACRPDVVLMDIGMPGIDGIEAVRQIRTRYPDLKILMQTVFDDEEKIFAAIRAGASGYILKNTPASRILEFITETMNGGAPMSPSVARKVLRMVQHPNPIPETSPIDLSPREREILNCLVNGMSYRLIAETCFISIDTVRSHVRNIYEKLHVHSKAAAVAKALRDNIL